MAQQLPQDYMPMPPAGPSPYQKRRVGALSVVAGLLVILLAAFLVNSRVLVIRKVHVVGTVTINEKTVAQAAGLDKTLSYFAVNEQKIAQGVESNRYLVFEKLEKHFPNALTLYIRERRPVVTVQEMGANYVLDAEGMVLERKQREKQQEGEASIPENLIVVTGLKPRELRVGKMMAAGSAAHLAAYRGLLDELTKQGFLGEISELNINDPENLYLVTRDGYTAHLGGANDLRPKIGMVRAVVANLRDMGKRGGMLEAGILEQIIYTPASP